MKNKEEIELALKKKYWGQHLWIRGSFCATLGNATDDKKMISRIKRMKKRSTSLK